MSTTTKANPFATAAPRIDLIAAFERPYEHAVAAARTCYSGSGIVSADQASGVGLDPARQELRIEQRDRIAASTFKAGHHTTLQHGHVSFGLDNVSRHFVWNFLHSHPFYNSEQVSQRYVEVRPDRVAVPDLPQPAREVYEACVRRQMAEYRELTTLLEPVAAAQYFGAFPARGKHPDKWRSAVHKKAQEVARYVLPVATHTYLVHTVSVLTLLRYHRLCESPDTPSEARYVVGEMCRQLFALDPLLAKFEVEPLPQAALPVTRLLAGTTPSLQRAMLAEFDAELQGKTAILTDRFGDNQRRVADAVREVLGVPRSHLTDSDAVASVLDPKHNPLLGDTLNTTTHDKLGRCLHAAHYAFKKKLSHAADSQDQRHRMTPASRPAVLAYLSENPDFVTPRLVTHAGGAIEALYRRSMEQTWRAIGQLREAGVSPEWQAYLLPNAVSLRFTETSDLLALRHKHMMRLCYNAQEEIWQASVDESAAIAQVEPLIGRHLLPPCGVRHAAGVRPYCPEGDRYCGTPVWLLDRAQWDRVL
jgi:thymidylate synthase ThyX